MRHAALALILCGAALAVGCGEGDEPQPAAADHAFVVDLTVTLDPDGPGGAPELTKDVACETVEDCWGLELGDFEPVPPQTACTEIYGGPDRLEIEGHFGDEDVPATRFTRANGCEIERFERFGALLAELFPDYQPGASLAP